MVLWKPIYGYGGLYEISSSGRVRSLVRGKKKILKPALSSSGRYTCGLHKNGVLTNPLVHRLVALAFVPNPHRRPCASHKSGNVLNNRASNIEWRTSRQVALHSRSPILFKSGPSNSAALLTRDDVRTARELRKKRVPVKKIARKLGVGGTTIYAILSGRTHRNVK